MYEEDISFRGQREGEKVRLLVHRHPWALVRPGLHVTIGLIIVILMFIWFQVSPPSLWTLLILGPIVLVYALYAWFKWWNTMYLLTDERVIIIAQRSLWSRRIEDYSLEKIQSVASDTDGPAGTLLNFGTVTLAIMGIKEPVGMSAVEDPYAVQEKILSAIKEMEGQMPLNHYQTEPRKKKRVI